MSSHGSKYGWVWPVSIPADEVLEQLISSLEMFGFRAVSSEKGLVMIDAEGSQRCFWNADGTYPSVGNFHAWYAHRNDIHFRPFDLGWHAKDYEKTQSEYDLVKHVFDRTESTECFGFHASQDNAVVFRDPELCFFFSKAGSQLALRHLDEHRNLNPGEEYLEFEGDWEMYLHRNSKLDSLWFTQFSVEYYEGMHVPYSSLQILIERPWKDYYHDKVARIDNRVFAR